MPEGLEATPLRAAIETPGRVFIVGCPRSGTTFMQQALALHPDVLSLPETSYFDRILKLSGQWQHEPEKPRTLDRNTIASGRVHFRGAPILRAIAEELDVPRPFPAAALTLGGHVDRYVDLLDRGARRHNRAVWIEKTPGHIAYVDVIEKLVPGAKFIHVLRNGEDVMASLVDAGLNFSAFDKARGFDRWIPHWVSYWNRAMETHLACLGRDNHRFVCHEDLVENFESESRRLRAFIGVSAEGPVTSRPCVEVTQADIEPWKADALSGAPKPPQRKFESLFGPEMQRWLRSGLAEYAPIRRQVNEARNELPEVKPRLPTANKPPRVLEPAFEIRPASPARSYAG